jgi:hypothetical protein
LYKATFVSTAARSINAGMAITTFPDASGADAVGGPVGVIDTAGKFGVAGKVIPAPTVKVCTTSVMVTTLTGLLTAALTAGSERMAPVSPTGATTGRGVLATAGHVYVGSGILKPDPLLIWHRHGDAVGPDVGATESSGVGRFDGATVGLVGDTLGDGVVGDALGDDVAGDALGDDVAGLPLGLIDGVVGLMEGSSPGAKSSAVGETLGELVAGEELGFLVGDIEGGEEAGEVLGGLVMGEELGFLVGDTVAGCGALVDGDVDGPLVAGDVDGALVAGDFDGALVVGTVGATDWATVGVTQPYQTVGVSVGQLAGSQ